jgi:NADH:ubiquinone oxidoreductase subunit 3 (subunit A)
VIILGLVYLLAKRTRHYDIEKISAYECGFEPFGEARFPFHIHFYVVALIFLVFDLEVAFLVP